MDLLQLEDGRHSIRRHLPEPRCAFADEVKGPVVRDVLWRGYVPSTCFLLLKVKSSLFVKDVTQSLCVGAPGTLS